jgi:hypothetical protein
MNGLELVGASALYLGGLYAAALIGVWITALFTPRLDSIIAATVVAIVLGGIGVVVGLVLLGMAIAG